jgi:hypothetical protein
MGYWGIGVLGYWGIGVLGYWGIGVLGYWGIGVLGYWGIGDVSANISHRAAQKNCDKNFCTVGICVSSSINHDA